MNTNGGGLSYSHSGMYGMYTMIELVRQLRGEAGERQVPAAKFGIAHGPGGMFAAAATLIAGAGEALARLPLCGSSISLSPL